MAMSMIKKGGKKNCIALAEFTTSRVASDRGFGRAFVWYYEVTYDLYFQSPELDYLISSKLIASACYCFVTGSFIVCVHYFPSPCFSTWGPSL